MFLFFTTHTDICLFFIPYVYETLCPQQMLYPNDNPEMIPNLDETHNGKGP